MYNYYNVFTTVKQAQKLQNGVQCIGTGLQGSKNYYPKIYIINHQESHKVLNLKLFISLDYHARENTKFKPCAAVKKGPRG